MWRSGKRGSGFSIESGYGAVRGSATNLPSQRRKLGKIGLSVGLRAKPGPISVFGKVVGLGREHGGPKRKACSVGCPQPTERTGPRRWVTFNEGQGSEWGDYVVRVLSLPEMTLLDEGVDGSHLAESADGSLFVHAQGKRLVRRRSLDDAPQ